MLYCRDNRSREKIVKIDQMKTINENVLKKKYYVWMKQSISVCYNKAVVETCYLVRFNI